MIKKIVSIAIFAVTIQAQILDINDVTVLLPIPKPAEENLLIKPTDLTRTGAPLLPADQLFVGFDLEPNMPKHRQTEKFRAIAIRIDHAFEQLFINLVYQRLANGKIDSPASIHSLHTIADTQLFIARLEELNKKFKGYISRTSLPLQINPTIKYQGFRGAYYTQLKNLIMTFINPSHRVTFRLFNHQSLGNGFAGWDLPLKPGVPPTLQFSLIPEAIHRDEPFNNWESYLPISKKLNELNHHINSDILTVGGDGPFKTKHFQKLMASSNNAKTMNENELLESIGRAYIVENPRLIPGLVKTDCLACHFAQPVRTISKKLRPELPFEKFSQNLIFRSNRFNILNYSPGQDQAVTFALGYINSTAVWSQRTINETAETLETINGPLRRRLTSKRIYGAH
jgi:hypothetical protein